ncbi:hypothetical protein KKHLCK_07820 [Candidatus Electrothrix laxa]
MRYIFSRWIMVTVVLFFGSTVGMHQPLPLKAAEQPASAVTASTSFLPAVFSLMLNKEKSADAVSEGYNLFAPMSGTVAYLMDNDGNIVHSWESNYSQSQGIYLLENS